MNLSAPLKKPLKQAALESKAVLAAGKTLWAAYFAKKDKLKISVKDDLWVGIKSAMR